VLVRHGDIALQFDAGRGTTLRLAEAGLVANALTAVFLTHVDRGHVLDLPDLMMTRWLFRNLFPVGPLPVVAAAGPAAESITRMLEPFAADFATRTAHLDAGPAGVALSTFPATPRPAVVWHSAGRAVTVRAVAVHHEPGTDAVAYRIDTPDAAVVISGDTRAGAEIEDLARGADLLVHEAHRAAALGGAIRGTDYEKIFSYHTDTVLLGAVAERAGVRHPVPGHPIPRPAPSRRKGSTTTCGAAATPGGSSPDPICPASPSPPTSNGACA
jgi:ribonuclease Z